MAEGLTVRELIKELTDMKKLGLADAVVSMAGCDCYGYAGSVQVGTSTDGKKNKSVVIERATEDYSG